VCVCVCDACLTLDEELSLVIFGDRVLRQYLEARNNFLLFSRY